MSCQFKNECPAYSGWCEGPKDDFSRCIPFIVSAVKGARQENATLHKQLDEKFELISQQGQELNRRDEIIKKQDTELTRVTAERDALRKQIAELKNYKQIVEVKDKMIDEREDILADKCNIIFAQTKELDALREKLAEKSKLIRQQAQEMERRDKVIKCQEKEIDREHDRYVSTLGERDGFEAKSIVLSNQLRIATAERDAALNDLRGKCSVCIHYTSNHHEGVCAHCSRDYTSDVIACSDCWQWRGPQKEDNGNDD